MTREPAGLSEPGRPTAEQSRDWARTARATLRARRSAAQPPFGTRFQSWYMGIVGVALGVSMGLSASAAVFSPAGAGAADAVVASARRPFAVLLGVILTSLALWGASALGPVGADRATSRWLLSSPADRRVLLRRRLLVAILAGATVGAVSAAFVEVALGTSTAGAGAVLLGLAGGVTLAVALVGWAVVGQARRMVSGVIATTGLVGAGLALAAAGMTVLAAAERLPGAWRLAGWAGTGPSSLSAAGLRALGLAVVVLAALSVAGAVLAERTLPRLALVELARGGQTLQALVTSTVSLDTTAVELLRRGRAVARRGNRRSRAGRGTGLVALLLRDLRSAAGRSAGLAYLLLVSSVPMIIGALLGTGAALVAVGVLGFLTARTAGVALRTYAGSSALRRALPFADREVIAVLVVLPVLFASVVGAVATSTLALPWWAGPVVGMASAAGAVRAASPPGSAFGPVLASPMGALPLGLLGKLVRGLDITLLLVLVLAVSSSGIPVGLAAGALAWQVLRSR